MEPEIVADYRCEIGEGPLWHLVEQRVYWTDIPAGRLYRYDPASLSHEQFYDGDLVGSFTFQEDGALLLFMGKGRVAVLRDGTLTNVIDELPGEAENRFNDVAADPAGRVFGGTMPADGSRVGERLGSLYRLDADGTATPVLAGLGIPNGIGFTPDRKGMYFTDSLSHEIYLFDYDVDTGVISDRRVFVRTAEDGSIPDGMTVDAEGYVWSARWDGSALYRYSPAGVADMKIDFPAKKVASVTFGGEDYTDIYVATAGGNNKPEEGPGAGALFRFNVGVRGVPEFMSRIKL